MRFSVEGSFRRLWSGVESVCVRVCVKIVKNGLRQQYGSECEITIEADRRTA